MARDYRYKSWFTEVTSAAVEHVAANMRQADIDEFKASHGNISARAILLNSLAASPDPYVIAAPDGSGEPVALIGTIPPALLGKPTATPWMLGTGRITEFARNFVVGGRDYVLDMLERYGQLENHVDERNVVSANWLRAIGFTLEDPAPYGVAKLPFHRFHAQRYT